MRRIGIFAGILLFLFLLCFIWPLNRVFYAFMKIDQMRTPYLVSFFALLFIAVLALQRYLLKASTIVLALLGAIVGHVVATISISIANLFIPHGVERTIKALTLWGIKDYILLDLSVAFVLGGWLFGAVSFVAFKFLIHTTPKQEKAV